MSRPFCLNELKHRFQMIKENNLINVHIEAKSWVLSQLRKCKLVTNKKLPMTMKHSLLDKLQHGSNAHMSWQDLNKVLGRVEEFGHRPVKSEPS